MSDWYKSIFGIAEYLYKLIDKIPRTELINQEATINVPESTVDYSLSIKIPSNFRTIRNKIEFKSRSIIRASATCLHPFSPTYVEAMKKLPLGEGYVFYPKLIPSSCELISISISYKLDDVSVLDSLVERTAAHEPSGTEMNEYWISAQIKQPNVLIEHAHFRRLDLRDVNVTIDVAISNELKTTIPDPFIRRLQIFFEILSEKDPRQQWKAIPRLRGLAKQKTAGKEFKILGEIDSIFLPREFSKYVEILKDFRYSNCYKGRAFYELPIEIIPKKMVIISRTDLTLQKPAAEGVLIYKYDLFTKKLKTIFS